MPLEGMVWDVRGSPLSSYSGTLGWDGMEGPGIVWDVQSSPNGASEGCPEQSQWCQ